MSSFAKYETQSLDTSFVLSDHSTALWAALSGALSAVGAWLIGLRKINASIERARMKLSAETSASEAAERAAFRATLMAELSVMRQLIRECEADKEALRERLNVAEGQILILKASNEIMEKRVAFFKERNAPQGSAVLRDVKFDNAR